jgi:hypothetical protein
MNIHLYLTYVLIFQFVNFFADWVTSSDFTGCPLGRGKKGGKVMKQGAGQGSKR